MDPLQGKAHNCLKLEGKSAMPQEIKKAGTRSFCRDLFTGDRVENTTAKVSQIASFDNIGYFKGGKNRLYTFAIPSNAFADQVRAKVAQDG